MKLLLTGSHGFVGSYFYQKFHTSYEIERFSFLQDRFEDLHVKGYQSTYYLQHYLHVNETLGETKKEQNKVDLSKLSKLLPIELRNF